MTARFTLLLAAALALSGCFHSVTECRGVHCPKDAGRVADGGGDAGADNDGDECGETDPSLLGPCTADGGSGVVFDGTSCSERCFATTEGVTVYATLRQCAFSCAFDSCQKQKLSAVTPAAICSALRVSTTDAGEVIQSYALAVADVDGGIGCNLVNGDCVLVTNVALGDAGYEEACAATLLPSTITVTCDP
jgi:hypothetical protein